MYIHYYIQSNKRHDAVTWDVGLTDVLSNPYLYTYNFHTPHLGVVIPSWVRAQVNIVYVQQLTYQVAISLHMLHLLMKYAGLYCTRDTTNTAFDMNAFGRIPKYLWTHTLFKNRQGQVRKILWTQIINFFFHRDTQQGFSTPSQWVESKKLNK